MSGNSPTATALRATALLGGAALATTTVMQWLRVRQAMRRAAIGLGGALPRAYESHPDRPQASVLVLGDSTGVGLGATHPEHSIAGQLGLAHPQARIVNRAVIGARFEDIPRQLAAARREAGVRRFDVILLLVGANDVLHLTPLRRLEAQAHAVLPMLARSGARVVWLCCGNIGLAPIFVPPWSWLASARTRRVCMLFERLARQHRAQFLCYFKRRGEHPFPGHRARYFSPDGVHPNSAAYRACWACMRSVLMPRTAGAG